MCEFVRHALIPQWDSISLANIVYEAEAEEEEEEEEEEPTAPVAPEEGREAAAGRWRLWRRR